jgi:nicotinate-nucleotide adenylyltransferase
MRIAVFGGSFNPPHNGHVAAAAAARLTLAAGRLIVVPAAKPPHKAQEDGSPTPEERLRLTRLAFESLACTEVSDLELSRGGLSYTVDTLAALKAQNPADELILLVGTDMLESFETWRDFRRIFALASIAAFPRGAEEAQVIRTLAARYKQDYGAAVFPLELPPLPASSTSIRAALKKRKGNNLLPEAVYWEIIKKRFYGAQPNLDWLREKAYAYLDEKRVPHVRGCEQEAVRLAERWGVDEGLAAEAAILHDMTKKVQGAEQLHLCEEYGIITDVDEKANTKLLHAKTGAALARALFGVCDEVYSAIAWHTTGRAGMSLLEKLIYIADYIEPTRDFEGVETLRRLAYADLDAALIRGLEMSLEDLESRGAVPHVNSLSALAWLKKHK